jgi:DNA-binding transcriptional LysR family regulator
MEFRDLRYFLAAAELGHLHKAAERIGRSQPALSKCIRRLEAELGAPLFEPAGRGIRLTALGASLAARARVVVRDMDQVLHEVTDLATGAAGHVRIGASPTAAEWLLPPLFRRVLARSPDLTFTVITGLGDSLRESLREGALDLIISPLMPNDRRGFASFPIVPDMMVPAARRTHPLLRPGVEMRDLVACGWVLPSESLPSTVWLNQAFEAQGLPPPRIQVETNSVLLLRRVIDSTDLLTFMSRKDLAVRNQAVLAELPVTKLRLRRHIGVLTAPERTLSPAAQAVLPILREIGRSSVETGTPKTTRKTLGRRV